METKYKYPASKGQLHYGWWEIDSFYYQCGNLKVPAIAVVNVISRNGLVELASDGDIDKALERLINQAVKKLGQPQQVKVGCDACFSTNTFISLISKLNAVLVRTKPGAGLHHAYVERYIKGFESTRINQNNH